MTRITHLMMDDSMFYDLSDLPYILCYTGAFFPFWLRFIDLHGFT